MSGYTDCACRDCFEIAIGDAGKAFCHDCVDAGCPDYQGQEGMSQECQSEDAYGGSEETSEAESEFYVSTYCNFAHRAKDGRPIKHECRVIPPAALRAEMDGDFEKAIELMSVRADAGKAS